MEKQGASGVRRGVADGMEEMAKIVEPRFGAAGGFGMLWMCGDGKLILAADEVGETSAAHALLLECGDVWEWFVDVPEGGMIGDGHRCRIGVEGVGCVKELNGKHCGGLDPISKKSGGNGHWWIWRKLWCGGDVVVGGMVRRGGVAIWSAKLIRRDGV